MFLIVLVDHFSKWPEVEIVQNADTKTIIRFLQKLFLREGLPKCIVSDNGPQFISDAFKQFVMENAISHKTTSLYHPAGNGAVERFNRFIKGIVQLTNHNNLSWRKELVHNLWAFHVTPCESTGASTFVLLRGRTPITKDNVRWLAPKKVAWSTGGVKEKMFLSND